MKNIVKTNNQLYGLVLAGGKSERMGTDKGLMVWYGTPQRYYLAGLLKKYCKRVFISCREDQEQEIIKHNDVVVDMYEDLGQYGALLSAMSKYPNRSWLVVACDMPFVDKYALETLISNRDYSMLATAYTSPDSDLPEPLLAIWEVKSRDRLLDLLEEGVTCPRKALIKSYGHVKLIKPTSADVVANINTPKDVRIAGERLVKLK